MSDDRVWHYVKRNETTKMPRKHVIVDTESRSKRIRGGHAQTWRVGVAHFISHPKGRQRKESRESFAEPVPLWEAVSTFAGRRDRTVLWAHNLGYDTRIAEAFTALPALGWKLLAHNLSPRGSWLVWRRDQANLTMVDLASVWPTSLQEIGKWFGMAKTKLPDDTDDDAAWERRCQSDVDITVKAVTTYLDWLESADMGNWQLTGAGQSWAAFRHRWMTHQMLVHADEDALAMERRAMWTGRCEAYWHGTMLRQVIHEWDLATAYARVARDAQLPVRLVGPASGTHARSIMDGKSGYAVLAECTVDTPYPVVPTSHEDRIIWPVGRFDTTLWDVEIREAVDAGATVTLHNGYVYKTEPALAVWADWVLDTVANKSGDTPPWLLALARHWGRTLPGRFAMRYTTWGEWGEAPLPATERRTLIDEIEGATYDIMHIGTQVWRETGTEEWSQSMPAITGYIMAICRVKLWRIINALPREAVLYVDTDSILVTDRWRETVDTLARSDIGAGLRLKKSWDGFAIYGPRQIITGERVRVAGVPIRAQRVDRHSFAGEVWESLDVALKSGRSNVVRTSDRVWRPTGVDRRRNGPAIGWTEPIHIGQRAS